MISSSLKALTHVATRSFWRFRIINNHLIKPIYFKNIQASKRFYYNTPGQSTNTQNFSETNDRNDENKKDQDRNLNNSSMNNAFHEVNQDENYRNTYVGDVEFKIPSQQSPINEDPSMKNQKENEMDYQKPIQSQSQSYNQSNTMNKGNNSYNINDNIGMKNPNEKDDENLETQVTDTNGDLDLSTKNFQEKMEEYTQNSSNDNTKESNKLYSKNEDYFLKDNNSEYNKYISNQPDTGFVKEDNLNNDNKTSNNYSSNQKPEIISSKNSNKVDMKKKAPQSKYSLFPSEKDREIEFDVNESLEGHNVTGRDETDIDKDEEPAKDHNMYHNKSHLFPNH